MNWEILNRCTSFKFYSPDGSGKPVKPWLYNFVGFLGRLKEATKKALQNDRQGCGLVADSRKWLHK